MDGITTPRKTQKTGALLADPGRYAIMSREEDRRLRLLGYEVYRFGAAEFSDTTEVSPLKIGPDSQSVVSTFFDRLLKKPRHPH